MHRFFTLLLLILVCQLAHAQSPYVKYLKGNQAIKIYSRMTDGNSIYLAGTVFPNNDSALMYAAKVDAEGDLLWGRVFHTHKMDYGYYSDVIPGEGLILAGNRSWWQEGITKIFLVRLDTDGDTLWTKVIEGYPFAGYPKVRYCIDGGFIVGSMSQYFPDFYLVKTDQNGNILWAHDFWAQGSEILRDIIETSDGSFLMVGSADGFGSDSAAMYAIKVSGEGDLEWSKIYDAPNSGYAIQALEIPDHNFLILGRTLSSASQATLLKINGAGDTLWTKSYSGITAQSITATLDGNYLIGGDNNTPENFSYQVIKISPEGDVLWNKGYFSNQNLIPESGFHCEQVSDSTIVLGSNAHEIFTGLNFNVLLRLNANGDNPCDQFTDVSDVSSFPVNAISVSPVQQSFDLTVSAAPCELKNAGYIQDYCLATATNNTMQNEDAFSVFPNPSSDNIKINTSLPDVQQILIRNLLGDMVISKAFSQGGLTDLSLIPTGIYFVEFKNDSGALVGMKKIIVE